MRFLTMVAAAIVAAYASLAAARATPVDETTIARAQAPSVRVEKAQYPYPYGYGYYPYAGRIPYAWGGYHYCWYPQAWRGAGWYWCGYARRPGLGWGGPWSWGWAHGWGRRWYW